MGLIIRDFLVIYILAVIGMLAFTFAIEAILGMELGNAFNIVPQIVAAVITGQRHGRRTGIVPDSSFSWRVALWTTLLTFTLSLVIVVGFIAYMGPGDAKPLYEFLQSQIAIVVTVFVVIVGIYVLITRFLFGLGAKQGAKVSPNVDSEIFR